MQTLRKYGKKEDMLGVPLGYFCNMNHMISYTQDKQIKARAKKKRQAEKKREVKQAKARFYDNDLPHQLKLTQKVFNKMRVSQELVWFKERGLEPTCISCGKPIGNDQWCCGHFKTVKAFPELRFDPINTYLQHNRYCNMALSGDICGTKKTHGYTEGIKIRFGVEEGQKILDYLESPHERKKYTCHELIEMRKGFNEEIRRCQSLLDNQ